MSGLRLVTPSATKPVSLVETKLHLRVDHSDDDTLITALIAAATAHCEQFLGRSLVDQTFDYYLDEFPTAEITLPMPPLIAVVGVFYGDSAGDEQPYTSFETDLASEPARVYLPSGGSWPTPIDNLNAVRIRFRAGYLDTSSPPVEAVPPDIRAAILLTIGTLYANRETVMVGLAVNMIPWSAEQLLRPHRFHLSMA